MQPLGEPHLIPAPVGVAGKDGYIARDLAPFIRARVRDVITEALQALLWGMHARKEEAVPGHDAAG